MECSQKLSEHIRVRPTLPASIENYEKSFTDVETAIRLPLFSCPFRGCAYAIAILFRARDDVVPSSDAKRPSRESSTAASLHELCLRSVPRKKAR